MTTPQKRKGDKAELEVQRLLRRWWPRARRALGAGRKDDVGDITGVPIVVSVANYRDLNRAVSLKLDAVDRMCDNARLPRRLGALWCRRFGGKYVVVMKPDAYVSLVERALGCYGDFPG